MSGKRKLLIAGGGYADIPLIEAGKVLGFHVITSGNRPDELGHLHSDEYHPADFSDREAMLAVARSSRADAICACCNDFSAISCAYVAEKLGLPGHDPYETGLVVHHKDRYRHFAQDNGIATPRAVAFADLDEGLAAAETFPFPVIVKPIDLSGGKGMGKAADAAEASARLREAFATSKAGRVVVEEFIEGTRHGFSAFIREGRVVFFFSDNEHYYKNPYLVSAASTPSIVGEEVEQKLCRESERIACLLSLKTGIFHVQYILCDGEPVIIEICRRSPGDLYTRFVEHATGVPYPSWIVRASAGMDCSDIAQVAPTGFFTRHCVMCSREGTVEDVVFDESVQGNVIDRFMWWKPGDRVTNVLTQKFGIVFLRFGSMDEMLDKTERMQDLICVKVR